MGTEDDKRTKPDWETEALQRVASRIESLKVPAQRPGEGAAPHDAGDPAAGFGWEESVLRNLVKRLGESDDR